MSTSCSDLFLPPVRSCNKTKAQPDDRGLPHTSKAIMQAALEVPDYSINLKNKHRLKIYTNELQRY